MNISLSFSYFRSYNGIRTRAIVRKEITELENLLKGLGSHSGISMVVKYQAEINQMQRTIQKMQGRISQIEE